VIDMTVLVAGASGFLGAELVRQGQEAGRAVAATYRSRPGLAAGVPWHRLDLRDDRSLTTVLDSVTPHVVINASSGGADWAATAEGGVRMARAASERGIRLIHVSSDAVFAGSEEPYGEQCRPAPITPYGAAKAAAETAVRLLVEDSVVARTSLIIGDGRSEHERMVHDLASGARRGVLFTDDVRCPVHRSDLAAALWELACFSVTGVCHLAGEHAV
jgi:dTDP-4-dehydrorhamnose reductase